jgi:hypothetical protein
MILKIEVSETSGAKYPGSRAWQAELVAPDGTVAYSSPIHHEATEGDRAWTFAFHDAAEYRDMLRSRA